MKRKSIGTHAHIALPHSVFQKRLHFLKFGTGRRAADAVLQTHRFDSKHGVRHKCSNVRPERNLLEVIKIVRRIVPGEGIRALSQYRLGYIFYARKTIDDGLLSIGFLTPEAGPQTTITH